MGFIDSLKEALGGDRDDAGTRPVAAEPRHADRDAPPESQEQAAGITGGKHRA